MSIIVDFWTFVSASNSIFLKKNTKTQIKLKPIFFFENRRHTFVKNAMILTCAKIQRKIIMFGEVGAPESFLGLKTT